MHKQLKWAHSRPVPGTPQRVTGKESHSSSKLLAPQLDMSLALDTGTTTTSSLSNAELAVNSPDTTPAPDSVREDNTSSNPPKDVIHCKCKGSQEKKGNRGTVQCSHCSNWSHLACYNLLTKETKKDSYVFTCDQCTKSIPQSPPPNPCSLALGNEVTSSPKCGSCFCAEVPALKSQIDELTSQIRSMQLQLVKANEEIAQLKHARPANQTSYRDALASGTRLNSQNSHTYTSSNQAHPMAAPRPSLLSRRSEGGSTEFYLSTSAHASSSRHSRPRPRRVHSGRDQAAAPPTPHAFRILWGTKMRTTEHEVLDSLTSYLDPSESHSLSVKKTVKRNSNSDRSRWWYTIMASQSVLRKIDHGWPDMNIPSQWSLCASLMERPRQQAHPPSSTSTRLSSLTTPLDQIQPIDSDREEAEPETQPNTERQPNPKRNEGATPQHLDTSKPFLDKHWTLPPPLLTCPRSQPPQGTVQPPSKRVRGRHATS